MTPIQNDYINALLADAVYVNVTREMSEPALKRALDERMPPTQAAYVAANFTVITSIETPNTINSALATGFDAVVWQIKANSTLVVDEVALRLGHHSKSSQDRLKPKYSLISHELRTCVTAAGRAIRISVGPLSLQSACSQSKS